jgi:hypothetical protein
MKKNKNNTIMGKDYKKGNNYAPKNHNNSKPQKAGKIQKPQALVVNKINKYVLGGLEPF